MPDVAHWPSVSFRTKPLVAARPKELLPVVAMAKPVVEEPKEEQDPELRPRLLVPVTDRNVGKAAVTFYKEGFGIDEVRRTFKIDIGRFYSNIVDNFIAELDFGGQIMVIHEGPFETETDGIRGFQFLSTPKPDEFVAQAVNAGALAEQIVPGLFGLVCRIKDPLGIVWQICTDEEEPFNTRPFLPQQELN
ncbi:hypothetical protein FNV43_RR23157 [Rhamnella rubrinervis]|uniref:VOC domain-containing protein n=1 Tax=Rhamnella rubrinervis TaxID=2594499 RepID=A0A8K0DYE2_9ROSA|nr:hypothetical protein FNV43_RR23157 [Rhamnella rubrinervis]